MIKSINNSSETRYVRTQSSLMFQEVSDGIYKVVKDRFDKYEREGMEYVTSSQVVQALNHLHKVSVVHRNERSGYTNFNFEMELF